jgi:glutamate-1-semialdehyde 2,1-aminomutase
MAAPQPELGPQVRGSGQQLYEHAKTIIPGGTQLLSKRPEMFLPGGWPAYYSAAKGAHVWDLDGVRYTDFSINGVGAPVLGFADDDVDAAVIAAVRSGNMATLNCVEEIELAELLLDLHPWAEMARFGRSGGEMLAVAVRIARAATGRDRILICGYHGWTDWYLAANLAADQALDGHLLPGLEPTGVPRGLAGTVLPFHYNELHELEQLIRSAGDTVAAIVMEPSRSVGPAPGFLEGVRRLASAAGAVLVFDEVTSGWRVNTGGIHLTYGVDPDMATFAKALGNGYPIAAVLGRRSVMEAAQRSFISSTSWTERVGPAAALAMIRKHRAHDVARHLISIGEAVRAAWQRAADAAGLRIHISGIAPLSHLEFDGDQDGALMTCFIQEMLRRGFLAGPATYATYAHTPELVADYYAACGEVFGLLAAATASGDVLALLEGPVRHRGFSRLT